MIVSCPACRTRYRYSEPVAESGAQAVCSSCEGVVPLVAMRQAYVVRVQGVAVPAGVPVGVAVGVGMDAPGPASGLGSLGLDGGSATDRPGASHRVMAPEAAPATGPSDFPFDPPVELPSLPLQQDVPQARPADGFELEGASQADAQPEVAARPTSSSGRPKAAKGRGVVRRALQLLAILVLAAAGAAAGEYATMVGWLGPVTVHSSVEPVRLGIIGGLLGVLIAWAGIRWTTPKS